ncbi:hypothetical protein IFR05_005098 [Cadophora sp. M221]|nr:hypothetical protein IFR05_005098 [Cadophora sp. M221]
MATSVLDKASEETIQDHGPFNEDADPQPWTSDEASETLYRWFIEDWSEPASAPRFPNLAINLSANFDRDSAYESMSHGANSIRSVPSSPISEVGNVSGSWSWQEGYDSSPKFFFGSVLDQTLDQNEVLGKDSDVHQTRSYVDSDEFSIILIENALINLNKGLAQLAQVTSDEELQEEFRPESSDSAFTLSDLEARYQPSQCLLSGCRKGYVFETFKSFQSHIKNVHSHAIWCSFPSCSHRRPFANKSDLKRHTIARHGDQSRRSYECLRQDCVARVKSFSRKHKLREHEWAYHGHYLCFFCSELFQSFKACAEHTNSEHVDHKLGQNVQRAEERCHHSLGSLTPAQSQGHTDHRELAEDMPKRPVYNHSTVKISPISKEVTALGDIEPAKLEYLNVFNTTGFPSRPSPISPVNLASPNEPKKISFRATSWTASDTACGSRKKLDPIEEAPENSIQQHPLVAATSSMEEDRGQEILRCLERNSSSSEGASTDLEDQELDRMGGLVRFDSVAECQDGKLDRMRQDLQQAVLDSRRQVLVEKIMDEFWQIWDSDWSPGTTQCASQSPSSNGDVGAPQPIALWSAAGTARQHKRQRRDSNEHDENDANDDDFPRRPTKRKLLSGKPSSGKKFSCPFRKYNPEKYSINDYHTCALTGQDTISRLKRCWKTFDNEGQLEAHATAPKEMICDSTLGQEPEGVTPKQAEKLRSRAHPYANQSEHDRWRSIYKILFSHIEGDNIPSPYFEEPREQVPQTPTSQALQQYESYVHNTVPVRFQSLVVAAVRDVMEPVEATFLRDLDIIGLTRSCLEEASREYREKHRDEGSSQPPVTANEQLEVCQSHLETSTATATAEPASQPTASINFLDEIMQPPPPQQAHYGLDSATIDRIRGNGDQTKIHNTSDSAYGSGPPCFCIGPCFCRNSERDTKPQGWHVASPQRDNIGDGGDEMVGDQTIDLDGVGDIDWNSYLESQALFGLGGQSQVP